MQYELRMITVRARITALTALTLAFGTATPAYAADSLFSRSTAMMSDIADRTFDLALGALSLVGIRYQRGGDTPETGFDCSGFVRHVVRSSLGYALPRSSREMADLAEYVDERDLRPGDLVFFNTMRASFSHVGIYLGDNRFVHAPASGGTVRVENMQMPYWVQRFDGARRLASLIQR